MRIAIQFVLTQVWLPLALKPLELFTKLFSEQLKP